MTQEYKNIGYDILFEKNPSELSSDSLVATNKTYIGEMLQRDVVKNPMSDVQYNAFKEVLFNPQINDQDVYKKFQATENVDTEGWWTKNIVKPSKRFSYMFLGTGKQIVGETLSNEILAPFVGFGGAAVYSLTDNEWVSPDEGWRRASEFFFDVGERGRELKDYADVIQEKPTKAEAAIELTANLPAYSFGATTTAGVGLGAGVTELVEMIGEDVFNADMTVDGMIDMEGNEVEYLSEAMYSYVNSVNSALTSDHNKLVNKYGGSNSVMGRTVGILDKVGQTLTQIQASLQQMRALGLKLPMSQRAPLNATKLEQSYEAFKSAVMISGYSFIRSPGDWEERSKSAGVAMVYMSTPIFSRWLDKNWQVFLADLTLNAAWTASPLWKPTVNGKPGGGYGVWKSEDLTIYQKLLWTAENATYDVYFSALTKSFRNSSDYKTMSDEDKAMFESVVENVQRDIVNSVDKSNTSVNNFIINKQGGYNPILEAKENQKAVDAKLNEIMNELNEGL